ncbi:MAG: hypothetical protein AAB268_11480 [Elusimicrobiota bacterium]
MRRTPKRVGGGLSSGSGTSLGLLDHEGAHETGAVSAGIVPVRTYEPVDVAQVVLARCIDQPTLQAHPLVELLDHRSNQHGRDRVAAHDRSAKDVVDHDSSTAELILHPITTPSRTGAHGKVGSEEIE